MKARMKFTKTGSMRFIGHLDVMRYFQKAFRRAGIRVSYSKGFSPHQIMSFASPLGLGLSSEGEYLDLSLEEEISKEEFLKRVNEQMNEEILVTDFLFLLEESKSSMAVLAACDYLIFMKPEWGKEQEQGLLAQDSFLADFEKRKAVLQEFLKKERIEILKKTKRSEKQMDIREYIYQLLPAENGMGKLQEDLKKEGYEPVLFMQLTSGSVINIKPELVLEALFAEAGEEYHSAAFQIHRLEMYGDRNMKKGEVHTLKSNPACELVSLAEYGKWKEKTHVSYVGENLEREPHAAGYYDCGQCSVLGKEQDKKGI